MRKIWAPIPKLNRGFDCALPLATGKKHYMWYSIGLVLKKTLKIYKEEIIPEIILLWISQIRPIAYTNMSSKN
jgi:hypothetical protein